MKKYSRHYLRRCLSVLLAVVMVCAAAQTLVFAVDLTAADITPGWQQGTARARYTTSGTLEITFPESTKSDAAYYAEFYDLDGNDRETPVVEAFQLNTARTYADDTTQIGATLDRSWVENSGLDMSHRINVAITAVSGNWRSEAIEALVGESLDVPQAGASPDGSDLYASLARFEETSPDNTLENGGASYNGAPYWSYDNGANGVSAMNIDGVFADGMSSPYQYPGFNGSTAFRLYLNGSDSSEGEDERFDVMYRQDHWQFTNAEDLWIWVDTSYVEFNEFAIQVHYMDYTGTIQYWRDQSGVRNGMDGDTRYSVDAYSTIGYAQRNNGASVPVYYLNEDGLWDVMYTNSEGYLEKFGHYRGFLRVPVEYLLNENTGSTYVSLYDERPYTFTVEGWANYYVFPSFGDHKLGSFTAEDAWNELKSTGKVAFWDTSDKAGAARDGSELNLTNFFNRAAPNGFSVIPIEDIASVGITWNGASADSLNKPFYIDQIGFSGANLVTNAVSGGDSNPVMTLDNYGMVPSNEEAVNQLIEQYIPDGLVSVSNAGIVEDLEAICDRLGLSYPAKLKEARATLDALLSGSADIVSYVETQLNRSDTLSSEQIAELYEVYRGLTLGEIHRLGVTNERKLIDLYNERGSNEWFPNSALNNVYFKAFNDVEAGYSVGDSALHEYDDYNLVPGGSVHYYDRGHILVWGDSGVDMTQAWENSRNLIAYSRVGYNEGRNSTNQRFGYGITTVGQNGFANSRSIDTDIYRDTIDVSGTGYENYRISLTYNGSNTGDWDTLEKGNFAGADYFTFYADFSNLKEIRKMWTTIRTGNGTIYSHDETDSVWQYQAFSLDNPGAGWQTMNSDSDGCLNTGLVGFRGFIRIPISVFKQIGGSATLTDLSSVGQVKVFLSGDPYNSPAEAGGSFVLDMFGFISNEQEGSFTQTLEQQYHHEVELPAPVSNATAQFEAQLDKLFVEETDINNNTIQLFDVSKTDAYTALVAAYNTMTLSEKENADAALKEASGGKYTGVDELQLFVKNYDDWGGLGTGNLKANATTADDLRKTVETVFGAGNALADNTPNAIDSIFDTYQSYPDYYKYSVQTYWPDRNLHAVFPNYNPEDVVTNKITMTLNGSNYTGTLNLSYVGAVSSKNPLNFKLPDDAAQGIVLTSADGTTITVTPQLSSAVQQGLQNSAAILTLTIPEATVVHQGTYTGSVELSVDVLPDTGSEVDNPEQYRQTITVEIELVCEATYTVTIPATVEVPWGSTVTDAGAITMTECSIPSTSQIKVTASHTTGAMSDGALEIPYTLTGADNVVFAAGQIDDPQPLTVQVEERDWNSVPISDEYQDTVTFTVSLNENA